MCVISSPFPPLHFQSVSHSLKVLATFWTDQTRTCLWTWAFVSSSGSNGLGELDIESFFPQNALPSDEDDKDPNDPYRALDIDLDK